MARFNRIKVLQAMEDTGVIPVFYNQDAETAVKVMKACYDGGIRVFEFTNRGGKAQEVFSALKAYCDAELPGLILGAGSISFGKDARRFIRLGADFIVGPQYVPSVRRVCRWRGIAYIPGCGTVSEIGRAQRAGCGICKVFPGDVLGPGFVKALRAPMPWSRVMVTGGVRPERENLEKWFKSGAACVGMGSNLFPKEVVAAGEWDRITELCRNTIEIIKSLK